MNTSGSISVFLSFLNTAFYHDLQTHQEYMTYFTCSAITIIIVIELILQLRNEIKRIHKMPNWLPAKALVLASRMEKDYSNVESDPVLSFKYRYNVNGTEYESTGIPKYFFDCFDLGLNEEIIEQFPEGSETQIYYNPENPGEALLMYRKRIIVFVNCIFLCLFWIIAMSVCSQLLIHYALYRISYILFFVFLSFYIAAKLNRKGHN